MTTTGAAGIAAAPASHVLGRKLDSIPFSAYHVVLIVVLFAGVLAPFLLAPYTASSSIFFGTMVVVVAVGAAIPVLYGRETLGQLETFTEVVPELA